MKKKIIEELEKRYYGPYVLNSVIEPIEIDSITLHPLISIHNTNVGYYAECYEFENQFIDKIEEFEWEKDKDNYYIKIEFRDGLLTMIAQEEYDDNVQWLEVKFAIIEKE